MGQLYVIKNMIKDLQGQKVTPNHLVVTKVLKGELSYLSNEHLTKTQIMKTIKENQIFPSTLAMRSPSKTKNLKMHFV